jgi:UDP-glucose 4-epimerase
MRKQILVTGGAGFIGSHTVLALHEAGFEPIIVDNLSNTHPSMLAGIADLLGFIPKTHIIDCCDYNEMNAIFSMYSLQGVIHFAAFKSVAESVVEPDKYKRNNLNSLEVILNLMDKHQVHHLVFSSSATVYGQPDLNPVSEETPWQEAASPYGWTKQEGERMIQSFAITHPNFKSALLRYFNPIGAHPSGKIGEYPIGIPNNLIPLVNQAAKGMRVLKVFGTDYNTPDGTCIRDYIHVMDLADAHVKALIWLDSTQSCVESFNLGQGKGDSVLEIIRLYEKVNQVRIPFEIAPRRSGDVEQIWADVNKANSLLQWSTHYSTEEALSHSFHFEKMIDQ